MNERQTPDSILPGPLAWIDRELERLDHDHLRRTRRELTPLPGVRCRIGEREVVNFASNDYLNLAGDLRVIAAAQRALAECGAGSRASALVCGRTKWHAALEERLARFERQNAAVLFPTGFAANMGTIAALVGKDDVVFSDRLNHASLIDGCRLSGAQVRIYDHAHLEGLHQALSNSAGTGRRMIVTDSIFSMDGDFAPLPELCDLAERFGAFLLVDEAHATGVVGPGGRGVAELQGVEQRIAVRVGTLSKAVGALGGFVAGPQPLVDWLWNRARPQMFSTALPPAVCAAAEQSVEIIETEPERRRHVLERAAQLRSLLAEAGVETIRHTTSPIIPIILRAPERAVQVAQELERAGFLVGAIRPPTVPPGTSRLRVTVSSGHESSDVEKLAAALARILQTT